MWILSNSTWTTTLLHRCCYLHCIAKNTGSQNKYPAQGHLVPKWHLHLILGQELQLSPLCIALSTSSGFFSWTDSLPRQSAGSSGAQTLKRHCWVQAPTPPLTRHGNRAQVTVSCPPLPQLGDGINNSAYIPGLFRGLNEFTRLTHFYKLHSAH